MDHIKENNEGLFRDDESTVPAEKLTATEREKYTKFLGQIVKRYDELLSAGGDEEKLSTADERVSADKLSAGGDEGKLSTADGRVTADERAAGGDRDEQSTADERAAVDKLSADEQSTAGELAAVADPEKGVGKDVGLRRRSLLGRVVGFLEDMIHYRTYFRSKANTYLSNTYFGEFRVRNRGETKF